MSKNISRRSFLKGSAMGLVGAGLMGGVALADETDVAFESSINWDAEYDVVVVGYGAAGAVSAITAADDGAKVLLIDKAPKGEEGGNSKYCGQIVMGTDDPDQLYKYLVGMAGSFKSADYDALRAYADGCAKTVDWMVAHGGNPDEIGTNPISEYPEFEGSDHCQFHTINGKMGGGYFYAFLQKNVKERASQIDVWTGAPARHLIFDHKTRIVHGVQVEKDGALYQIRAKNGVILTCGGFEHNDQMINDYLGIPGFYTWAALYNEGDGIRMAQEIGADMWHMGVYAGPLWGWLAEGADPETMRCLRPGSASKVYSSLGVIVGPNGSRFFNEGLKNRHGRINIGGVYMYTPTPDYVYAVFDDESRKANLNGFFATWSEAGEEELAAGHIISADTLEELAAKIGVPVEEFVHDVTAVNDAYRNGTDAQYELEHDKITPVLTAPFYAVKLVPTMYNTDGGPRRNAKAEILDTNGLVIPHLYSAGELGSIYNYMYNGSGNQGECLVFGQIAGHNASAAKDDVLAASCLTKTPVNFVDQDIDIETGAGEYIGVGTGIAGDVKVKITVADGKLTAVSVVQHNETEGIGTLAVEQIPEAILKAQTYDVDVVSGATVTSNAIKLAVQDAMKQAGLIE